MKDILEKQYFDYDLMHEEFQPHASIQLKMRLPGVVTAETFIRRARMSPKRRLLLMLSKIRKYNKSVSSSRRIGLNMTPEETKIYLAMISKWKRPFVWLMWAAWSCRGIV